MEIRGVAPVGNDKIKVEREEQKERQKHKSEREDVKVVIDA